MTLPSHVDYSKATRRAMCEKEMGGGQLGRSHLTGLIAEQSRIIALSPFLDPLSTPGLYRCSGYG